MLDGKAFTRKFQNWLSQMFHDLESLSPDYTCIEASQGNVCLIWFWAIRVRSFWMLEIITNDSDETPLPLTRQEDACSLLCNTVSGMFRRSASLSIPHRISFAAIPSVTLVLLGHTNRKVSLSHELQHETALIEALSRPVPDYQHGEVGEKWAFLSRGLYSWRFPGRWHRTIWIRIRIATESHDTMPLLSTGRPNRCAR